MRFKTDENVHPDAAELLRQHGHDVRSVWEQGLGGHSDSAILEACSNEGRVLLTLDLDFADIRTHRPALYPGILVVRPARQGRSHLLRVLGGLLPLLEIEPIAGSLWVADEGGVRIRAEETSDSG
jgi:hypothetical protein